MEKIHVYQIYFPISGKSYIGQTKDMQVRMSQHLRSGKVVCKALWKYDDWQVSILHTCKTRDEAHRIEIEEIRNHNSVSPNGYNLTAGGEGATHCKETKEKIRKAHQGIHSSEETRKKMSETHCGEDNGFYGKQHSDKTKVKIA